MNKTRLLLICCFLAALFACEDEVSEQVEQIEEKQIQTHQQIAEQYFQPMNIEQFQESVASNGTIFSLNSADDSTLEDSLRLDLALETQIEDTTYYTIPFRKESEDYFHNLFIHQYDDELYAWKIKYTHSQEEEFGYLIDVSPYQTEGLVFLNNCHRIIEIRVIIPCPPSCDCLICAEDRPVCIGGGGGNGGAPGGGGGPPNTTPVIDDDGNLNGDLDGDGQLADYEECVVLNQEDCWQHCGSFPCEDYNLEDARLYDCIENDTGCELVDPCKRIDKRVEDNTEFRNALNDLRDKDGDNFESLVTMTRNGQVQTSSGNAGEPFMVLPDPASPYTQFAHNHPSLINGQETYSIFSFADLRRMSDLAYNGHIKTGKFVAYLRTAKGTNYALTIDRPQKFSNGMFFYWNKETVNQTDSLSVWNKFYESRATYHRLQYKYYGSQEFPNPDALIKVEDDDNEQVLQYFLEFLEEADIGVTLYESDGLFQSFTELSLNNGQVSRTPCN